jgi:HPt (histidine-containing phosphotransfer) domain-containing protein
MTDIIDAKTFNALKELGGEEFVDDLVDTFMVEAPKLIDAMKQALADSDAESFRRAAHSLKSNAATFGATQLSALAKELEMIARENRLADAPPKLDQLAGLYDQAISALEVIRAR